MIEEIIRMAESLYSSDDITVQVNYRSGKRRNCVALQNGERDLHITFGDTVEEAIEKMHAQVRGDYQAEVQRLAARLKELDRG